MEEMGIIYQGSLVAGADVSGPGAIAVEDRVKNSRASRNRQHRVPQPKKPPGGDFIFDQ